MHSCISPFPTRGLGVFVSSTYFLMLSHAFPAAHPLDREHKKGEGDVVSNADTLRVILRCSTSGLISVLLVRTLCDFVSYVTVNTRDLSTCFHVILRNSM